MANWRHFDWLLFFIMIVLIALGCIMIYSAYEVSLTDMERDWLDNFAYRQILLAGVGLILYFVMAGLDYRLLIASYRWLYLIVLVILVVTLVTADPTFGTRAWLDVGTFGVQPSELGKILMIIVLAQILGNERHSMENPTPFLSSVLVMVPPVVLIYLQVDFGMALLLSLTWIGMVFLSGVRWRHLAFLGTAGAAAAPLIWFQLEDYMRGRIFHFVFPGQDLSGASYNINQALISIGSGGWWGKGIMRGTQSQLHFLRVRHTDFIFSVLCEELGFVGALLLMLLFAALVLRLMRIADGAHDRSGRLIVVGMALVIFIQVFINMGMNANLLPVTGLPLPMISYGGSSLVSTMMALGLAQSVAMRQRPPENPLL